MSWNFELVAGPFGGTTEGPVWDGEALLFTHIPASRILRYDPATGAVSEYCGETFHTNGLCFDAASLPGIRCNFSLGHYSCKHICSVIFLTIFKLSSKSVLFKMSLGFS